MATELQQVQAMFTAIRDDIKAARLDLTDIKNSLPTAGLPPPPSVGYTEEQLRAKYARLSGPAFVATYHVAFGAKLPALSVPLDKARVSEYAANGYNRNGDYVGGPTCLQGEGTPEQVAAAMLEDVFTGKKTYPTGFGGCDPDVNVVIINTGLVLSEAKWGGTLGGTQPLNFAGQSFDEFVANMVGGPPGGPIIE